MGAAETKVSSNSILERVSYIWIVKSETVIKKEGNDEFASNTFSFEDGKTVWRSELVRKQMGRRTRIYLYLILESSPETTLADIILSIKDNDSKISFHESVVTLYFDVNTKKHLLKEFTTSKDQPELSKDFEIGFDIIAVFSGSFSKVGYNSDPYQHASDEMIEMLRRDKFSDVEIHVDDVVIKAHRAIMSAGSKAFAYVFENMDMSEKRLDFSDYSFEILDYLIKYIYGRKVPKFSELESNEIIELQKAANKYLIEGLRDSTAEYLGSNLRSTNVIDVLLCADAWGMQRLKTQCMDFICEDKESLSACRKSGKMQQRPDLLTEILVLQSQFQR